MEGDAEAQGEPAEIDLGFADPDIAGGRLGKNRNHGVDGGAGVGVQRLEIIERPCVVIESPLTTFVPEPVKPENRA